MHYHLEIIMPPTDDIGAAVEKILEPFNEQPDERDEDTDTRYAFWDFYVIGGRWAGNKLMAAYDKAKLNQFHEWLHQQKVTVSGFQCGKQELSPASQIPMVDAKWNEMFPSQPPIPCPLFKHSNDQYGRIGQGTLPADVSTLATIPESLKCSRIIIAGPGYKDELSAQYMLVEDAYNGVNYMPVAWDGSVSQALEKFREKFAHYKPEYADKVTPKADWLVVTVDYHS